MAGENRGANLNPRVWRLFRSYRARPLTRCVDVVGLDGYAATAWAVPTPWEKTP